MIPVTRPYLPSREKLDRYIDGIYQRNWLTNNGPLVQELTQRLEAYLGVENLLLVSNGTLALQIAYRALGISGHAPGERVEAVTTPFTFVATSSSLKWEGVQPAFADIDPETWCLDPARIESAVTRHTRAIVPVHVFGNVCEVEAIERIAGSRGLKVVYDGAHAFGVRYQGESLLRHGDATTLSFHATKLFHTVEGGAIVFRRRQDLEHASKLINFGLGRAGTADTLGINAKLNEFQAAMGLCVLDEIENNLCGRAEVWHTYEEALRDHVQLQKRHPGASNNYAYFPLALDAERQVEAMMKRLSRRQVMARRYFHPALETFGFLSRAPTCRHALGLARRVLCIPVYERAPADWVIRSMGIGQ